MTPQKTKVNKMALAAIVFGILLGIFIVFSFLDGSSLKDILQDEVFFCLAGGFIICPIIYLLTRRSDKWVRFFLNRLH